MLYERVCSILRHIFSDLLLFLHFVTIYSTQPTLRLLSWHNCHQGMYQRIDNKFRPAYTNCVKHNIPIYL